MIRLYSATEPGVCDGRKFLANCPNPLLLAQIILGYSCDTQVTKLSVHIHPHTNTSFPSLLLNVKRKRKHSSVVQVLFSTRWQLLPTDPPSMSHKFKLPKKKHSKMEGITYYSIVKFILLHLLSKILKF